MLYKIIRRSLILLYTFTSVYAGDTLSFEQYAQKVTNYSQVLKQAGQQTFISEARRKISKTGFLPQFQFTGQGTLDLKELNAWTGEANTYRNHTYLGQLALTQPIYSGGAIKNQYKISGLQVELSLLNEEFSFDNIYYQSEITYWTASANRELYMASRKFFDIVKEQYNVVEIRFNDGMIGKTDLLMIKTRLKEAELQLSVSWKNYMLAYQNFNILMGISPEAEIMETEPINIPSQTDVPLLLDEVLSRRPDYQSAQLDIKLQEYSRKIELAKFNPQLALSLQGGWGTLTPNLGYNPDFSGLAALTLNIPLPIWGDRRQTSRLGQANIHIRELEQSRLQDEISVNLSTALTNMEQTGEQIQIAEQNMNLAEENLSLVTFSYNEGKIPIVDVLSAQLSWIQARTNTISAHLSHKMAIADYRRVTSSAR